MCVCATCLNTLRPLHTFIPTNNAVHRRMFIPISLFFIYLFIYLFIIIVVIVFLTSIISFFSHTICTVTSYVSLLFPSYFCFGRDRVRCHLSLGGRRYYIYLRSLVRFTCSPVLRMCCLSWDDSPHYST